MSRASQLLKYLVGLAEMNPMSVAMSRAGVKPPTPRDAMNMAFTPPPRRPAGNSRMDMLNFLLSQPGMLPVGATVYHGTPHKFAPTAKNPLGEFDMSKMGTGEGAQAYGHGVYVADNPAVAKSYEAALGRPALSVPVGNKRNIAAVKLGTPADIALAHLEESAQYGWDPAEADRHFKWAIDEIAKSRAHTTEARRSRYDSAAQLLQKWQRIGVAPARKGTTYRADLPDEHIANMLDWDAPLNTQSEHVRARLIQAMKKRGLPLDERGVPRWAASNPTGEAIHANLASKGMLDNRQGQEYASGLLGEHGIPGLKYYDQGSRAAGKGSRNYVVWKPDLLRIMGIE